jgi:hypothetical protein
MFKDSKMHALWCVGIISPQKWFICSLNLIYSFYDFKEYILRVISFKDIYQIFLNGILFKNCQICLIAQFLVFSGQK